MLSWSMPPDQAANVSSASVTDMPFNSSNSPKEGQLHLCFPMLAGMPPHDMARLRLLIMLAHIQMLL